MTKEQAIAIYKSGCWREWTDDQKVRFQLFESRLCMPFDVFHAAIEKVLNRPVWTHEFAYEDAIIKEYLGEKPAPTMDEIIDLIPAEKRLIIGV
jgi:hypothetical protein